MYRACFFFYLVALCLCHGAEFIGPYAIEWQRSYGGELDDVPSAVRELPAGGFIVVGKSTSPTNESKSSPLIGLSDGWLVRLDAAGNKLWDRAIGGTNVEALLSVDLTSDGGFIVAGGSFSLPSGTKTSSNFGGEDFWVARLDSAGNQLWERSFGGLLDDFAAAVRQTSDGGFIVAGTSASAAGGNKTSGNFGGSDFWVVRLDAGGNRLWDRSFGGTGLDELSALQITAEGGFLLGGSSLSGISGNKTSANFGNRDCWLVRLDSDGNVLWDRSYGGNSRDELHALESSVDGGYIIGSYSASGISGNRTVPAFGFSDYWVVRITDAGTMVWDSVAGGEDFEFFWTAEQMQDGDVVAGGFSVSPISGNKTTAAFGRTDYWLVGMDRNGAKLWDAPLGGTEFDEMYALRRTRNGGLIVGGGSSSPSGTGNKTSQHYGAMDFWIVKLALPAPQLRTIAQTQTEIQQGGYRLFVSGASNLTYVTELSSDLMNWGPLQTNRLTGTELPISDTTAGSGPHRFYRARILR
jgi:hypothetical protein